MQTNPTERGFTRGYLYGAITAIVVGVLWGALALPPPAQAQIPDSGAQRHEMVRELKRVNQQLAEMAGILKEIRDLQKGEGGKERGGARADKE